jgi:hypothetical protein
VESEVRHGSRKLRTVSRVHHFNNEELQRRIAGVPFGESETTFGCSEFAIGQLGNLGRASVNLIADAVAADADEYVEVPMTVRQSGLPRVKFEAKDLERRLLQHKLVVRFS